MTTYYVDFLTGSDGAGVAGTSEAPFRTPKRALAAVGGGDTVYLRGNKEDPAKKVQVDCRLSPARFWVQICDEGPGFKPAAVPDCCAPDRLEACGGRGLALIEAYMTAVQYNQRGNCLTMEKCVDPADGEQPAGCPTAEN